MNAHCEDYAAKAKIKRLKIQKGVDNLIKDRDNPLV